MMIFRRGTTFNTPGAIVGLSLYIFLCAAQQVTADEKVIEPISPVPQQTNLDPRKVALGRGLFSDSRLSGGNGVSCTSCHLPQYGLTDNVAISHGLPGAPGLTNTPTIFNIGLNPLLNWSGQTKTLEEQASRVVEQKNTMGAKWPEVVNTLRNDSVLTKAFSAVYDDGIKRENVIDALVEYEKSLNTPDAPFDQYLRGNTTAISEDAKSGYRLFKDYGCISCHQGVNVGGNMLQVFGIFGTPDAAAQGSATPGSAKDTGISTQEPVFRVPSLRNVAVTSPYFHDGSTKKLEDAINIMANNQLGRDLEKDEVGKLKAFLTSLTGKYEGVPVGELRQ